MQALRLGFAFFLGAAAVIASAAAYAEGHHYRHRGGWDTRWPEHLPSYLSESLDPSAVDPDGGDMFAGAGNSVDRFVLQRNVFGKVEVALKAKYRQGEDIPATFVGGDGLIHIVVPRGTQVGGSHGVPADDATKAAWSFDFSLSTALGGSARTLTEYEAALLIDLDPSRKVRYVRARLSPVPGSSAPHANGYGWKAFDHVLLSDDEGTPQVTQNSFNYAFVAPFVDTDRTTEGIQPYTFGEAEFDVELTLRKRFGPEVGHLHVVFNVN
jgi:hypothetical protein